MSTITAANLINTRLLNGGTFDATFVTRITGSLFDINSIYGLSGITGLGDEDITISDTSVDVTGLNTLDNKTTGSIDASTLNTLTGAAVDLNTAFDSGGISNLSDQDVTLTDTSLTASVLNALNGKTTGSIDASTLNTLTGAAVDLNTAFDSGGISNLSDQDVTLTDTSLTASVLNALNGKTTGSIDASSITALTGSATDLIEAVTANGITGLGDEAITVDSGTATTAQANDLAAATSGIVTATIAEGDLATLAGLTGTGNAYSITIDDAAADAAALNTLDAKTTVAIDAAAITTLTGAAVDLNTAFDSGGISNLSDQDVTLTDTSLTASVLNALDNNTTGIIDASTLNTLTGAAVDLNTAFDSGGISNLSDQDVTLTDTSLTASVLNALDDNTSGTINANTLNTLTGAAVDLNTAFDSGGISNLGDEDVTLTDTSLTASVLNALNGKTTGSIDASAVTTLTGTAAELIEAVTSDGITGLGDEAITVDSGTATTAQANDLADETSGIITATIAEGDLATLAALNGTGNAYSITINDASVDAAALNTLDGKTTVAINAAAITTLTGAAVDLNTAFDSGGISNLSDQDVTLTDSSLTASVLNALNGKTTGSIDASTLNTLTGAAVDLNTAFDSGGISNLGDQDVTLTDTSLTTSVLNALDNNTTGSIDASTLNTLSGAAVDLNTAFDSGGISNLSDQDVTLTDTSLTASVLNALDNNTSGSIDASTLNTLTGAAVDLNTAFDSGGISNLSDQDVTLTDTSLTASVLNALDDNTSGTINANTVNTLTGSAAELIEAVTSDGITGLGDEAITVDSGTATTAQANDLADETSGIITATIAEGDLATLAALNGTGNAYSITINDASVDAAALNTLDGKTTVAINAAAITTLTGAAVDLNTAFDSGGISNLSDQDVTLTDTSLTASVLNALDNNTTGSIDANTVNTLTGSAAELIEAVASNGISNLGDVDITVDSGTATTAQANDLADETSGIVTATIAEGDLTTLAGLTGTGNAYAITIDDASIDAAALNTLDGKTTVAIDAAAVTTLTGAATDLIEAVTSNGITGLGDEAITVDSGTATTAQANALADETSGIVTAAIAEGDLTTLAALNGTGNAYSITIDDASVDAAALNTLDGKTTVAIDAAAVTTLTGAAADLNTAFDSGGISNLSDQDVTLTDTSLTASVLNALDNNTTGSIDANTVNTLTGSATDLIEAVTSDGITGLGDEAITVDSGTATTAQANALADETSGIVTATIAEGDLATLAGLTGTGNAYSITIDDASVDAAALNTLDGKTTVAIDAAAVTTLTGAAVDLNTAFDSGGISNLSDQDVTLTDSSLTASVLNALDGNTTGSIDASAVTTLTGAAVDLNTAFDSGGISNLGDQDVTLTDTSLTTSVLNALDNNTTGSIDASTLNTLSGAAVDLNTAFDSGGISNLSDQDVTLTDTSLTASVLNALDNNTSGSIDASTLNTLTGAAVDLNTAFDSGGISNLGDEDVTLTDTSLTASVLNALDDNTTGSIDASSITALTGSATDLIEAVTANGITGLGDEAITVDSGTATTAQANDLADETSGIVTATIAEGDLTTLAALNGTGNAYSITIDDASVDAAALNTLDGKTTVAIDAAAVTTLTGAAVDLNTAFDSGGISNLSDQDVTLTDTSLTASVLNALDGNTTGSIDASSITTLTGTAAELIEAVTSDGITGLGDEAITVDSGTATTAQANALADETSGIVTATIAEGDLATLAGLTGTGNAYSITINDASVDAAALNTLDGKTTVAINAAAITTLTGAAVDLNTAFDSGGISNLGDEDVTLTDTSLTASVLNALDNNTTGSIDANTLNTLTGAAVDLNTAFDSGGISNLSDEDVTLTDTSLTASVLNALDNNTSGSIDASTLNTLTGAAVDLNTAFDSGGISNLVDQDVTLTDTSLTASVLNALDDNTTGSIDASSITALTGSATDLIEAVTANGITGLGDEAITVDSGTATTAQANDLADETSGIVTATIAEGDLTTLAALNGTGNAYSITIDDASVDAAALNTLDGKTTVAIDAAAVTTLTGLATDLIEAVTSNGITGLGDEAITVDSGTATTAQANALADETSGIVTAAIAEGDLTTLAALNGTGNAYSITIDDASVDAAALNTLDAKTTVAIDAAAVTTLAGAAIDLDNAFSSAGITGLGNEAVTLSDTSLNAAVLNTLDDKTTGIIDAGSITTLTGEASELNTAFDSSGISNLDDVNVTVDIGTATTAQANALADETSGIVTATIAEGDLATLAGLTGTGNAYSITIDDASVDAAALNTLDGKTTVAIDAAAVTTLTGAAVDLNTAFDSGGISNLGDEDVTLTDTSLTASVLNALDNNTTGIIDASTLNTLTGAAVDLNTAFDSGGISNLGDEDVTLTDTSLTASVLNALDDNTSGTINANTLNTLSGAAVDLNTAFDSGGISNLGDEDVTLTDTSLTASVLNALDNNTTGSIDASSITALTGSATDLIEAVTSSGITGLGNEAITVDSGTATTTQANALADETSGIVTATIAEGDLATLAGLTGTGNAYSITIDDASIDAAALNTLDGKTTVAIDAAAVTTLTGAAVDLNTAFDSGGISNLSDQDVTLTDTSLTASVLNALDDNTSGTINANTVNTLTGAAVDLNTAFDSGGITGLGDEAITVDNRIRASEANTLNSFTSGIITATITNSDGTGNLNVSNALTIEGTGNAYSIRIRERTVSASDLLTIDGITTTTVNAQNIRTLTGSNADINSAYAAETAGSISGLGGNVNFDVSGSITVAEANTLSSLITSNNRILTATISDGDLSTLAGISESGNSLSVTISDTSVDAAALNTLDGKTTVAIDAAAITTLTGAAVDLNTAFDSGGISNLGDEDVTLTDTSLTTSVLNALDNNTTGSIDANTLNTLTGAAVDLNTAFNSSGISNLGDEDVTLTDSSLTASVLNALDNKTSGSIDASTLNTLTGAAVDLNTAFDSGGISNLGDEDVTLTDTSLTASVLNALDNNTTGSIDASTLNTLTGAAVDLNTAFDSGGISNLSDQDVTLTDTSLTASVLNALDGNTTGSIDANTLNTLTGAAVDLNTAFDSGGISNLSDQDVTLTDSLLTASVLNALDNNTTGSIDANTLNTLTGAAVDLNTAFDSGGISNLSDQDVTLTDTSLTASVLNALDDNTSGTINANTLNTLTGAAVNLNTAFDSGGISNLGDEDVTLTDTSLTASVLNALDNKTSGSIDASTLNTLTGAAVDLNTAFDSGGISNLSDQDVTLTDTSLTASVLNALDNNTTGIIDASTVNTLTGAAVDLNTAFDSGGISNLGDQDVTLTDTSLTTSVLNALDNNTTGSIDASTLNTLSGAAVDLNTAFDSGGISNLGDEDVTLTDTSLTTSVLNALDNNTTGSIDASTLNTLSGAAVDLNTAFDSGGISNLSDQDVTLTDTSLTASVLNALDNNTSGSIDASTLNTLTGAAVDLNTAFDSGGISNLSDQDVTLTDTSLTASVLNALDDNTSGTINANTVNTLTGAAVDLNTAFDSGGISNLVDQDVTLTDSSLTASVLNALDGNTTGSIDASAVTTLTGAAVDLNTAFDSGGISNLSDQDVTLTDTSLTASVLNALDNNTTGSIDASSITALTGAAVDLNTAFDSGGISNLSDQDVTLTDTSLTASVLNALDNNTTGSIDASSITALTGAAVDLNTAFDSGGISNLSDQDVTLTDTSLTASVLNALDNKTSGSIDASSITTLSGTATDLIEAVTSSGITGLGNEAITVNSGTATTAQANALADETSGIVTATIAEGDLATLAGLNGTGNAYSITIDDAAVDAAALNTLDAKTTVAIDAAAVTTLTGLATDLIEAVTSNGITGLGNEAITVNSGTATTAQANALADETSGIVTATIAEGDLATLAALNGTGNAYSITIDDASVDAAALNTLDGKTTVAINAAAVTTLTGAAVDLNTAFDSGGISNLSDQDVTLTDTSLTASVLNALDNNTSGSIDASTLNTLTGAAVDLNTAFDSGGISNLSDQDVTLTDTSLTASVLNALDDNTSGTINANTVNTLTGSAAELIEAVTSDGITGLGDEAITVDSGTATTAQANDLADETSGIITATIAEGDLATLAALNGTGNAYSITINDASVDAAALNTLDAKTTVAINAAAITTLTGAAVDLNTAFDSGGISNLSDQDVTLTDTTLAAAVLNALDNNTTGSIDANTVNTLTGAAVDLNTAFDSGGISNLGDQDVTLTDTSLTASVLNALNGNTTGSIDASSITTLSGTATDLIEAVTASGITGLGNEAITVNSGTASISQANTLADETSGIVTATIAEGDLATLAALNGTGNAYALTITNTLVNAAELNALNIKTITNINGENIIQISGAVEDIAATYTEGGIDGLGDEEIIFTFSNINADSLAAIDAANSRVINAIGIEALTGSATDLNTVYESDGISGLGDEPATLTDTSLSASTLNALDRNTSGNIDSSSLTTLTGTATELNTAFSSTEITGLGNEDVTLSDTTLDVSILNTLGDKTSGTIDASAITTLTGAAADLNDAYAVAGLSTTPLDGAALNNSLIPVGITGLGNEDIILSDTTLDAAILNILDGNTTGTIDASSIATLTGLAAEIHSAFASPGISGLRDQDIILSDNTLDATDINALKSKTTGSIDASSITALTGSATDLIEAVTANGITGLGDEAITVDSGTATTAQANALAAATSGIVTATIAEGDLATLAGLTGDGNAYSITIDDASVDAAALNTLDEKTTVVIDASATITLSGTSTEINTAFTSPGISGLRDQDVILSDISLTASVLNALDNNTTGSIDASTLNTLTGAATDLIEAVTSNGITGLGDGAITVDSGTATTAQANALADETSGIVTATIAEGDLATLSGLTGTGNAYAITISDTAVNAAILNAINNKTINDINGQNIIQIEGTAEDIATAYTASGINGLGDEEIIFTASNINASDLIAIDSANSQVIDASTLNTLTGAAVDLNTAFNSGGISNLSDQDVTLTDTSLTASVLNALDNNTTGSIDASSITALTGAAVDLNTAFDSGGISNLSDQDVTLTDTSLTASVLNALNGKTSGSIDASTLNTLTGAAVDLNTAFDSGGISNLSDQDVTLTDSSLTASVLNDLDGNTTGSIDASTLNTLTGAAVDLHTAFNSGGISNLSDQDVTLTDTSLTASVLNALNGNTTGNIDASTVTALTGAAVDLNTAFDSGGISNLGDQDVTLTDSSLTASVLNALNGKTSGSIDASTLNTLTGAAVDLNTAFDSVSISNLSDQDVTLTDTSLTASVLNALNGNTTGSINANSITTFIGAAAELNSVYASTNNISGLGDENVTLSDITLAATVLNSLEGKTSGTIDASSISSLAGTAADLIAVYNSNKFSGLNNEEVTLSDTTLDAAVLNTLDDKTTGTIDASTVTTLTGTATELNTAFTSTEISGLGNENVTLSDTTLTASVLNALDDNTTGSIDAASITALTGSATDLIEAVTANGITGLGDEAITVDSGTATTAQANDLAAETSGIVTATIAEGDLATLAALNGTGNAYSITIDDASVDTAALNTLDGKTTVAIDAAAITTLTGAAVDLNTAFDSGGISNLGDQDVTLTDTTLAAAVLNTLDGNTTGTIDASAVTTLTGTAAELIEAVTSDGITGLGSEAITVDSGTATTAQANDLAAETSGIVTATIAEGDLATLTGLNGDGNAYSITIADASVAAAALNTLDRKTTVVINAAAITTLTGFPADILTSRQSPGIVGLSDENGFPTIGIISSTSSLNIGKTASLTFVLSDDSSDFTESDITISGGTLSNFSGSGSIYTATFTPNANSTIDGVIEVGSNAFSSNGIFNNDGDNTNNTLTLSINTVRPVIALTSTLSSLKAGDTTTLTFTLSEPSSDFSEADITISGGTLSNFSGSGSSYTATFTPDTNSTSDAVISVASGTFSNSAGNTNNDGDNTNNTLTLSINTVRPVIALTSTLSSLKAGDTTTLTFTLSEPSSDFSEADITVSGGTLSNFSGSGSSYTATFTPDANSTSDAVISVASGTFSNSAGNTNNNGDNTNNSLTLSINTVRPVIALTSTLSSLKAGDTTTLTFTLSEPSSDFLQSDISVSGGTLSNFSGSGSIYTATFTPDTNSTIHGVIEVGSNAFSSDGIFNNDGDDTNNTLTLSINTVRPTIALTSDRSSLQAGDTATLTFTLSEPSSDFSEADITISGGTLSNFSGSGSSYTATFTANADSTSDAVISVASGTFSNSAGNTNNDGDNTNNTLTLSINTVRPTIALTSDRSSLQAGDTATLTFTLSEPSSDFSEADITVSGGTLSNFSGSGSSYTATFTANADSTSDAVISVASDTFSNSAGNTNNDGDNTNNTLTLSINTVRPTIALTSDRSSLQAGDTATLTFTLSEPSSDFSEADITVSGGTLSNFSGSGSSYTATFTADANSTSDAVISVASGTFSNSAGNTNNDGDNTNNTLTLSINTVRPTITLTSDRSSLQAGDTTTLTFTLSEPSSDFSEADITISGGTLSNFAGSGSSYTATFTANADSTSDAVISVASGTFSNSAGNTNNDGDNTNNTLTLSINTVRPTIALTSDRSSLQAGDTATLTFTLSEPSSDFSEADITVSGGTLSNFSGSGSSYTATFTANADSTSDAVISVASDTFSNSAGNTNNDGDNTNNTLTLSINTVRPTIALTSDRSSLQAGDTATLTFTLSEPSSDFSEADITVSGGTLSNFSGSGSSYTATFTADANSTSDAVISVASGTFSNSAGNTNNDGDNTNNTLTLSINTVRPTITLTSDRSSLQAGDTTTLTFTLSEPSSDFSEADITISGGTLSNFAGSGSSYTATFTADANSTSDAVISVASGTFSNSAGNTNNDGDNTNNTLTLSINTVRPTIALTSDRSSLQAGDTATLTFTLSEPSSDFSEADISVSGGTLSNFAGSGSSYTATFTANADSTSDAVISVASGTFSNSAGNTNNDGDDTNNTLTLSINTVRPTISTTITRVDSTTPDGICVAGDVINLSVSFSEPVVVDTTSGTPTLQLETGTIDRFATYISGSGTSTLTFQYIVQVGDTSADLDQLSSSALALNGGSIADTAGNSAILNLPNPGAAGSLSANKNLVIKTTIPTVSVAINDGGDSILNAAEDSSVTISGTTTGAEDGQTVSISITDGSNTINTTATVNSNSYSVSGLDLSSLADGTLNISADVSDLAGNSATQATDSTTKVTASPSITRVDSTTADGSYGIGSVINLTVTFDEDVVVTGTPALQLETGTIDRKAIFTSGSGTNTLTFQYIVQDGDSSADLDQLSSSALALNGGTIQDAAGNNAILNLPNPGAAGSLSSNADLVIDGIAPFVSTDTRTYVLEASNPFGISDVGLSAKPTFADIDGDDDLDLFIGNRAGNTLFFRNTAASGSTAPAYAPAVTNPFGITDVGRAASPTLTDIDDDGDLDLFIGNRAGNTLFFRNNAPPGSTAPAYSQERGANGEPNPFGITDVGRFAKPAFTDTDNDGDLDLFIGNLRGKTLVFRNNATPGATTPAYAPAATNPFGINDVGLSAAPAFTDADGDGDLDLFIGNRDGNTLVFRNNAPPGSTAPAYSQERGANGEPNPFGITDVGFNASPAFADPDNDSDPDLFIGNAAGDTLFFRNTGAAPGVNSSTVNGVYTIGAVINLTIGFSKPVVVDTTGGTPTLQLETGTTDRKAIFTSGSGTNTLTFQYTVQDGDTSADLDQLSSTALALNGGSITDANGNPAILSLPQPGTQGSLSDNADLIIDTNDLITSTIRSSESLTLPDGLANLILTGTDNLNGTGNDLDNRIEGNSGKNRLNGKGGNDTLIGKEDKDKLTGGSNADTFLFQSINDSGITNATRDQITDFTADDTIDLSRIDADPNTNGDQAFVFIGSDRFSDIGQARFNNAVLRLNIDDDLFADFQINLKGVNELSADSLIL
ncbi:Ig-like domain-containing protein [Synechococcus sp. W2B2]|uniref:Ig-like domain-containing protein n=1 Tax=Synechococcus sp. W2B2 TaxID=3392296 RepID=UPI0039ECB73A